jgi:uncharacterized protein (DUF302 family)
MVTIRHALAALALAASLTAVPAAAGPQGMVMMESEHSVDTTLDRLADTLKSKGLTVFARVDHAANAAGADLDLPPTQVLIFGNPNLGTPLMQANPSIAIDLPQKALAYEDAEGRVWLAYNDPRHLAERHDVTTNDAIIDKIAGALQAFARQATQAE